MADDAGRRPDGGEKADEGFEASLLDGLTHAELLAQYQGCQDNIRFAKAIQWKTVVWSVLFLTLLTLACYVLDRTEFFVKTVIWISIGLSMASIYALSIYQSWQGTEREKVRLMVDRLSGLAARIHRIKSRLEANVHRFTLYGFMVLTVVVANYLTVVLLMRLYPG